MHKDMRNHTRIDFAILPKTARDMAGQSVRIEISCDTLSQNCCDIHVVNVILFCIPSLSSLWGAATFLRSMLNSDTFVSPLLQSTDDDVHSFDCAIDDAD